MLRPAITQVRASDCRYLPQGIRDRVSEDAREVPSRKFSFAGSRYCLRMGRGNPLLLQA